MRVSFCISILALVTGEQVLAAPQYRIKYARSYTAHPERAAAVKEAFHRAWDGYYTYAFPNDSLKPISKSYENDRNGWGASAVDALSTALLMEDEAAIKQIVDFIPKINFDETDSAVSLFETTIRYLAGLLSAHDLLEGPLNRFIENDEALGAILKQATHLADVLKVAFDTPTGIPVNTLLAQPIRPSDDKTNGLATIGTLVLEWMRLSDKTGNPEYGILAEKAQQYLLRPEPQDIAEPFPGLLGTDVNISTGQFINSNGGWGGGTDSFYEYLIKMYLYDTSRYGTYRDRWIVAADSSIRYMASHPTTRPELTFMAGWRSKDELSFSSGHLDCFAGGNFILGGLTLDREDYVKFGLELTNGCHETYLQTATGIGPESFRWQDSNTATNASNNQPPPSDQTGFYDKAGFWISTSNYITRPEVIESIYYAYRATGDSKYQDWAWDAFQRINATCSAGVGFAEITDVNAERGGSFVDKQESFLFAEVLKYSYLIQAEEAPWQVSAQHGNEWVFNTEAHPFKIAGQAV